MDTDFYAILKDAVTKLECVGEKADEGQEELVNMFHWIVNLERAVREEGLLALEDVFTGFVGEKMGEEITTLEECDPRKLSGAERLLMVLIWMVLSGHESEQIKQVALMRYYVGEFEGNTAMCACMAIVGMLSIHSGEHPMLLRDKLLALLPEKLENRILEEEMAKRELGREQAKKIPQHFFEDKDEACSVVMDRINTAILSMEDDRIKRMIQDVGRSTLTLCMKAMKGSARKRIFENLSSQLGTKIYEDMNYMGPVRLCDAEEAALAILNVIDEQR